MIDKVQTIKNKINKLQNEVAIENDGKKKEILDLEIYMWCIKMVIEKKKLGII